MAVLPAVDFLPIALFCFLEAISSLVLVFTCEGIVERGALLLTWKLTEPITVRLLICLLRRGIVVAVVVDCALLLFKLLLGGPSGMNLALRYCGLVAPILAGFVAAVLMFSPGFVVALKCLVLALRKTLPVGIF